MERGVARDAHLSGEAASLVGVRWRHCANNDQRSQVCGGKFRVESTVKTIDWPAYSPNLREFCSCLSQLSWNLTGMVVDSKGDGQSLFKHLKPFLTYPLRRYCQLHRSSTPHASGRPGGRRWTGIAPTTATTCCQALQSWMHGERHTAFKLHAIQPAAHPARCP